MGLKEVLEKMKLVEVEGGPAEVEEPARPARSGSSVSPPPPGRPAAPPPPPAGKGANLGKVLNSTVKPKLDEAALPKTAGAAANASSALGEIPAFEAIFKASGVTDPAHGFSAYKVLEILQSPDFEGLEGRAKAAALSGFLKMNPSGPVAIADVIQDAVRRDQALDGFEEFLRKKLDGRRESLDTQNGELQAEIDEIIRKNKEKMDANRRTLEEEKERFATWQARKRIEERKLHDAVAPFVEQNPVTLGSPGEAAAPASTAGTAKPSAT